VEGRLPREDPADRQGLPGERGRPQPIPRIEVEPDRGYQAPPSDMPVHIGDEGAAPDSSRGAGVKLRHGTNTQTVGGALCPDDRRPHSRGV